MGKNKELHKELKSLQSQWKQAEPRTFSTIADGDYVAKITEMSVETSKSGRIQVVTTFKIADGKMKGKEVKKFDGISSEQNMQFFKGYCQVLGIEIPEDLSDLPEALDEFVSEFESLVNIAAVTKDEYQNIRVKGLSEYESGDDDDSESSDDDDDSSEDDDDEDSDDDDDAEDDEDEDEEPKKKKKGDKDKKKKKKK